MDLVTVAGLSREGMGMTANRLNGRPVFAISAKSRQITRSDTLSGVLILPANQNEPWAKGNCAVGQINQAGGMLYRKAAK